MDPAVKIGAAIEEMIRYKQYVRRDQILLGRRGGVDRAQSLSPSIEYCIYRSGAVRVTSPAGLEPVIRGQDLIGFRLIS